MIAYKPRGGFGISETGDISGTLESEGGSHQGGPERTPMIAFDRTRGTPSGDIDGPLRKCGAASDGVNGAKADTQCVAYGISNQPTPKIGIEIAPSLDAKENGGGRMECVAYGVSENQRAELKLTPYSRQITSGGGKPGQGYPCVAIRNSGRGAPDTIASPLTAEAGRTGKGDSAQCVAFDYTVQGSERTRIVRSEEYAQIRAGAVDAVAFARSTGAGWYTDDDKGSVRAQSGGTTYDILAQSWGVRRLTPVECCRLQGLPDDWVDGEGQSDSAKYRQLGNAVCEPVVRWIGCRIHAMENGELL